MTKVCGYTIKNWVTFISYILLSAINILSVGLLAISVLLVVLFNILDIDFVHDRVVLVSTISFIAFFLSYPLKEILGTKLIKYLIEEKINMQTNNNQSEKNICKLERDGKIAVVISPGYGCGWSSRVSEQKNFREFLLFDSEIALAVLDGDRIKAHKIACDKMPDVYISMPYYLEVQWIEKGTAFEVMNYDGNERIRVHNSSNYSIA